MRHIYGDETSILELLPKSGMQNQVWSAWSSPEALGAHVASVPVSSWWTATCFDDDAEHDDMCGGSVQWAKDTLRDGWQEGAERVARVRDKINATRPHAMAMAKWDVAGAYPSVPRMLACDPCHMRAKAITVSRQRPVITLVNHMGGTWIVPAECFVNRAAIVAAIVDVIEEQGYSVHVVGVSQSKNESHLCGTAVTIKRPGEHVDLARLSFALGHAAFFRRFVFGERSLEHRNKPLGGGLGNTCDFTGERSEGVYILPSMNGTYGKFESEQIAMTAGLEFCIKTLREQGCPAFAEE